MKKYTLLVTLVIVFISSCRNDGSADTELFRTAYIGNELDVASGVYVRRGIDNDLGDPHFFYRDGVSMYTGEISQTKLEEFRSNGEWGGLFMSKSRYGVFEISDGNIRFEEWLEPVGNDPYKTIVFKGAITSDTSFVITEVINNEREETYMRNYVYELERFSPKPDSTNMFVQ